MTSKKTIQMTENPLVSKLLDHEPGSTMTLRGYVGPTKKKGYVSLYSGIEELTQCVVISEDDIIHYEEAPADELPFGGVIVWVLKDADIRHENITTRKGEDVIHAARQVINQGRLHIQVGSGLNSDVCQSVCRVCQSVCATCRRPCSSPNNTKDFSKPKKFWK